MTTGDSDRDTWDILAEYRARGLAAEVGLGTRPAVLVVDFIRGFTDPASPLGSNLDTEVAATGTLLEAARRAGIPIFFTTTAYDAECREAGLFVKKVPSLRTLVRGSRAVELDPRLGRREHEVLIEKHYASAFFGTSLASMAAASRVDTLLIAGCTTSGCIRATAVDALQHGFRGVVVLQCVGDRAPEPHRANLIDIQGKYCDVMGLDEVLDYLEGLAAARA